MKLSFLLLLLGTLLTAACSQAPRQSVSGSHELTIIAMNDVYRMQNLPHLATLRHQLQQEHGRKVLVLHAGDLLFPSLLSRRFDGEHMIDVLNHLDGDAESFDPYMFVSFGNHEFDKSKAKHAPMLQSRLRESQFTWLNTNLDFTSAVQASQMARTRLIDVDGVKVGILGAVIDTKKAEYIRRFLPLEETVRKATRQLRKSGADVVIAVTHLRIAQDKALLEALGEDAPDLVVGGHEHDRQTAVVNGRQIIKADADAHTVAVIKMSLEGSRSELPAVQFDYVALPGELETTEVLQQRIAHWKGKFDREHCGKIGLPTGCLSKPLGYTQTELVAEELAIRRFETSLGNWLADLALHAFVDKGAQIAFLNSGGMRLNRNIAAASPVSLQHIDTLFAYPTRLVQIQLTGKQLKSVLAHAVHDWTGNGHWLQVSGMAFRHNPASMTADRLHLVTADGLVPIRDQDMISAVVNDYLINQKGDQDGFTMLREAMLLNPNAERPDLKDLATQALLQAGSRGIAPKVEGRVCNTQVPAPCLISNR